MSFMDEIIAFRDSQVPKGTPPRIPMIVRSLKDAVGGDADGLQLAVNFQTIAYQQAVFQSQSRAYGRTNFYFGTDDLGQNEDVVVLQISGTSGDIRRHLRPLNRASESAPLPPDYEEASNAASARLASVYRLSQLTRQPKFFVPREGGTYLGHEVRKGARTFNWVHLYLSTPLLVPLPASAPREEGPSTPQKPTYIPLRGFFSQPLLLQEQAQQTGFVNYTTQFTVLSGPTQWFFGERPKEDAGTEEVEVTVEAGPA